MSAKTIRVKNKQAANDLQSLFTSLLYNPQVFTSVVLTSGVDAPKLKKLCKMEVSAK